MKWTDIYDIAIELSEKHEDVNPVTVRFTDLKKWVEELDGFDDDPERCGEKNFRSHPTSVDRRAGIIF